mmetsp:Transcript_8261/g.24773  ORF Transcript_8261/g.24773 Transcript_8261/m.24773 type:complete len:253 (+) Transcript_8261:629-1387(+)
MKASDTNAYAMAERPAASAPTAASRKRCSESSGKWPAMAVTISCTNWKTLRHENCSLGASGCFSSAWITRESASARKTRGTSVYLMRARPPCPKCLRMVPSTLNSTSVSSCSARCARRATSCCSRSTRASTSGLPSSSAGGAAPGSSFSRGPRSPKRDSTASIDSRGSPARSTASAARVATSRRRAYGRYARSGSSRSSCSKPVRPRDFWFSASSRHRSRCSASSSGRGSGSAPSSAAARSTAATVPRQWFT